MTFLDFKAEQSELIWSFHAAEYRAVPRCRSAGRKSNVEGRTAHAYDSCKNAKRENSSNDEGKRNRTDRAFLFCAPAFIFLSARNGVLCASLRILFPLMFFIAAAAADDIYRTRRVGFRDRKHQSRAVWSYCDPPCECVSEFWRSCGSPSLRIFERRLSLLSPSLSPSLSHVYLLRVNTARNKSIMEKLWFHTLFRPKAILVRITASGFAILIFTRLRYTFRMNYIRSFLI